MFNGTVPMPKKQEQRSEERWRVKPVDSIYIEAFQVRVSSKVYSKNNIMGTNTKSSKKNLFFK